MAVVVTDERTVISEADATTGWTGSTTVSLFTSEPTAIESTGCLGMVVSIATQNAYFTVTAINFSNGATPGPSLIYAWVFHRAELDTKANGGLMIQLGDGTNRAGFHIAGQDVSAFRHDAGPVGWQCLVLDTNNLPSQFTVFAGARDSLNLGAITQIGIGFKTLVKAVGGVANCFWDIMRYAPAGKGLVIVSGSSGDPGTFAQIATADRQGGNLQAYGIIRELQQGVYGIQGNITFGDNVGAGYYFKDSAVTVVFENRVFNTGSDNYIFNMKVIGNATAAVQHFELGVPVGTGDTQSGRSGVIFSNANVLSQSIIFDASDPNVDEIALFGCSFSGIKKTNTRNPRFSSGSNTLIHSASGVTFDRCSQVDLGLVKTRNCTFTGFSSSLGASLIFGSASTNIKNSQFIANTMAIEHSSSLGSPFTYDNLKFSANDFDINNTSGLLLTASAINGSNPSTFTGSLVIIENAVSFVLTGLKTGSEVRIYTNIAGEAGSELAGVESSSTSFTYNYNYAGDTQIIAMIFHLDWVDVRLGEDGNLKLLSTSQSIPVQQTIDRVFSNPA